LICGLVPFQAVSAKADDASIEGARAVLIQLAELSKKQAMQTEAAQRLLTGEMLELKMSSFGALTDAPDKVLLLEKKSAVGRFQRFGENNQVTDVYFYLQNDGHWKVNAVRVLALTGIIEGAYLGLKAKPNLTEAERSLLENFRLTLAPDKELKSWFAGNSKALENLCRLMLAKSNGDAIYVNSDDKNFPAAAESLRKLNMSTASVADNGNVEIVIGGVTDNTVGFLYSPSKNPPRIGPSLYIWVEEVAANWYLFRTT
jgi:hypothetical protein